MDRRSQCAARSTAAAVGSSGSRQGRPAALLTHHSAGSIRGRAPDGSAALASQRTPFPSAAASASPRLGTGGVASSTEWSFSAAPDKASRLPLDLLGPAAERWASTAFRTGRRAPRVHSTLGPQSEVVDTGVFVCPDTVVAALFLSLPGCHGMVVTAELGGWLRLREHHAGSIRYQQQLPDGGEVSCLSWASTGGEGGGAQHVRLLAGEDKNLFEALRHVLVVGELSGLVHFYAIMGESLVRLSKATCVLHEAPLLHCVPLCVPVHHAGGDVDLAALLSVDADGVVGVWQLTGLVDAGTSCGGGALEELDLTVRLLDCSYASLPGTSVAVVAGGDESKGVVDSDNASSHTELRQSKRATATPVVAAAAAKLRGTPTRFARASAAPTASPLPSSIAACSVFSTHRFSRDSSSCNATRDDGAAASAANIGVFLCSFQHNRTSSGDKDVEDALNTTPIEGGSISTTGDAQSSISDPPSLHDDYRWEVTRTYCVPDRIRNAHIRYPVAVTALCLAGSGRVDGASVQWGTLWAGTADGRLLVWQAHTKVFLRCLQSSSAAPVHSLTCTPSSSGDEGATLVWAAQADGSVTAWNVDTLTVAEVLPVSYPPLRSPQRNGVNAGAGVNRGEEAQQPVAIVKNAVDLLRATRHAIGPSSLPRQPWNGGGFTLFLRPMERVCMQRAWTVATDGTVRTWLLPIGAVASPSHRGSREDDAPSQTLDAFTVHRFLQDKAKAVAEAQQAQRLVWRAQQAQLQALQERNEELTSALQKALGQQEGRGANETERAVSVADLPTTENPAKAPSVSSEAAQSTTREATSGVQARTSTAGGPLVVAEAASKVESHGVLTTSAATGASMVLPSPAPERALRLQQLLEGLHAQLEESWSRNDALREELLTYQLRTLGEDEGAARRGSALTAPREATATASGGPPEAAVADAVPSSMVTAVQPQPSLHPPSILPAGGLSTPARVHRVLMLPSSPLPPSIDTREVTQGAAGHALSLHRPLQSPPVCALVHSPSPHHPSLPSPPPHAILSLSHAAYSPFPNRHAASSSHRNSDCSPGISLAAKRFFQEASAALHEPPATRRVADAALRGDSASRCGALGESAPQKNSGMDVHWDVGHEPALVEAWSTSVFEVSPIVSAATAARNTEAPVQWDVSRELSGRRLPSSSSSFISCPQASHHLDRHDREERPVHTAATREEASPNAVTKTWTIPARAVGWAAPLLSRQRQAPAPSPSSSQPCPILFGPSAIPTAGVAQERLAQRPSVPLSGLATHHGRSPILYRSN